MEQSISPRMGHGRTAVIQQVEHLKQVQPLLHSLGTMFPSLPVIDLEVELMRYGLVTGVKTVHSLEQKPRKETQTETVSEISTTLYRQVF